MVRDWDESIWRRLLSIYTIFSVRRISLEWEMEKRKLCGPDSGGVPGTFFLLFQSYYLEMYERQPLSQMA
jgi:hypothetical protein